jgi:prophage tail gpP-like protein
MTWPASEVAVLRVNGQEYTEWESVWIQERWNESFSFFKFTANEGRVMVTDWHSDQFAPGNDVDITLGGQPVITGGTIITRQTSYNANQHMVQLTGKTYSFFPYKSSVMTDNGNFDGKTFVEIAHILLDEYGGFELIGTPDSKPYKKAQAEKGAKIWDYLETLAREKGILLGTSAVLGIPQVVGPHTGTIIGTIADGVNVLSMQCTITCEDLYQDIDVHAQNQGDDQNNGTDASEKKGHSSGTAPKKAKLLIPMEHPPIDDAAVQLRADYEKKWTEATKITANATVQGWFTGGQSGQLWEAGKDVMVNCPLAMVEGVMKLRTVTFQQDNNSGTTTTLELVQPWGLNDNINADVSPPANKGLEKAPPPNKPPVSPPAKTGNNPLGAALGLGDIQATLGEKLGIGSISPSTQKGKR